MNKKIKKKTILFSIIAIVLCLIILTADIIIYYNSYLLTVTKDFFEYSYEIQEDNVTIKIIPKTNIKNLKFSLQFCSWTEHFYEEYYIEHAKEGVEIIYTYSTQKIINRLSHTIPTWINLYLDKTDPGKMKIKAVLEN